LEAKTYYIDKQYQLPEGAEIHGAGSGKGGTIVQAVGDPYTVLCDENAKNRKGFLFGDNTYIGKLHYIGMETMRLADNGLLCGGAPFETPGCTCTGELVDAPVDCLGNSSTGINGNGVNNVTLEDITVEANTVQQVFYMAPTKSGARASSNVFVSKIVTNGTWADGMNIHGSHRNIVVQDCDISNTGDDTYAIWSVNPGADNISFYRNAGKNPWYRPPNTSQPPWDHTDNCFANYGGKSSKFINNTCIGASNAMVIFGNDQNKTYGGTFYDETSTVVKGNRHLDHLDQDLPNCFFGVYFKNREDPKKMVGCEKGGPAEPAHMII